MQTLDGNGHPRVNAYLKHFDAYATETNRMHSDNNITLFDFWGEPMPTDLRAESLRKLRVKLPQMISAPSDPAFLTPPRALPVRRHIPAAVQDGLHAGQGRGGHVQLPGRERLP